VLFFAAFAAALLVETIPVFAPPAWTILAFIIIKWKPNPWGIIAAGALGSVIGRYILTLYMPHVSAKIFRPSEKAALSCTYRFRLMSDHLLVGCHRRAGTWSLRGRFDSHQGFGTAIRT
jgi:hypothetical protein